MKVAKLVCVSLMTRVVIDENATEQEILELAIPKLSEKLMNEPLEHIESIENDEECPFGVFSEDIEKLELIAEEVFLSDDEDNPVNVYAQGTDTEEDPIVIYTVDTWDEIRVFELTKPQSVIEVEHRDEILDYRLSRVTPEDEVCLADIVIHGKFIKEKSRKNLEV